MQPMYSRMTAGDTTDDMVIGLLGHCPCISNTRMRSGLQAAGNGNMESVGVKREEDEGLVGSIRRSKPTLGPIIEKTDESADAACHSLRLHKHTSCRVFQYAMKFTMQQPAKPRKGLPC